MEINNNNPNTDYQEPINCSQLSCKENIEVGDLVRKVTNEHSTNEKQHVCSKALALKKSSKPHSKGKGVIIDKTNSSPSQNNINIQLQYDINQAIELDI